LAGGRAGALVRAGRAVARRLLHAVRGARLSPDYLAILRAVRRALPERLATALFRRIAGADRMGAALGAALAGEWAGNGISASDRGADGGADGSGRAAGGVPDRRAVVVDHAGRA